MSTLSVPISLSSDGAYRVGGTRVTLDTVIGAWQDGATAEEIVSQYSTLQLADVYAVIGYYLQNREEVETLLARNAEAAAGWRELWEKRYPPHGLRARLLARQKG
jgi:uncharacterized protein (DUF433 family)